MTLGEYFLLAFASIFWPLLIAIVVVALRMAHPVRILSSFLAAGLIATISIGLVLVFSLQDSELFSSSHRRTLDPAVDITVGLLALLAAYVLRGMQARRTHEPKTQQSSRTERYVSSARLAFVAGIVLNIVPGLFPLIALKGIAEGSYSGAEKITLVVVFYLIMFTLVELPIVGHVIVPDRTAATVQGLNTWLDLNGRRIAVWVFALIGAYLVVRGLVDL